jgi:hypothetical protein
MEGLAMRKSYIIDCEDGSQLSATELGRTVEVRIWRKTGPVSVVLNQEQFREFCMINYELRFEPEPEVETETETETEPAETLDGEQCRMIFDGQNDYGYQLIFSKGKKL